MAKEKTKEFYIYAHYTLDTNEIFYIGKGKGNRLGHKRGRSNLWKNIVNKHGYSKKILWVDKGLVDSAKNIAKTLTSHPQSIREAAREGILHKNQRFRYV